MSRHIWPAFLDAEGKLRVHSSSQSAIWNDILVRAPFAWSMRRQLQQILPMLFTFVSVMLPLLSLYRFIYIHICQCVGTFWCLLLVADIRMLACQRRPSHVEVIFICGPFQLSSGSERQSCLSQPAETDPWLRAQYPPWSGRWCLESSCADCFACVCSAFCAYCTPFTPLASQHFVSLLVCHNKQSSVSFPTSRKLFATRYSTTDVYFDLFIRLYLSHACIEHHSA